MVSRIRCTSTAASSGLRSSDFTLCPCEEFYVGYVENLRTRNGLTEATDYSNTGKMADRELITLRTRRTSTVYSDHGLSGIITI